MSHSSRSTRLLAFLLLAFAATLIAAGCGGDDSGGGEGDSSSDTAETTDDGGDSGDAGEAEGGGGDVASRDGKYSAPPTEKLDPKKSYKVEVTTNKGAFTIDVDPKAGPIAAANFVFLVREGFYDGIVFHRIIKDFMVQTGDPTGTGSGGPGYDLKDDPVKQPYKVGTVAMANAGPDTGGSQFFIVTGPSGVSLPPQYVIFGQVEAADLKVVKAIESVPVETSPTGEPSMPSEEVLIESAKLVEGA